MTGRQEVIDIAKQSEDILLKARDYATLSETMSQAGIRYFISGQTQNGIDYLHKAYDYAKLSKNVNALTKISINLGVFTHASGDIEQSFTYLYDARDLALQVSNIKNYLTASINLGVFQLEKGLFSEALTIFDEAIEQSERNDLMYQTSIALTNKAEINFELGKYTESLDVFVKAQQLTQLMKLSVEEAINIQGIVKSNIEMNNVSEIEEMLNQTKEIFTQSEEVGFLIDNDLYLARFHLKQHHPQLALDTIEPAILQSIEIEDLQKEVQTSRCKVRALQALSKLNEAFDLVLVLLEKSYEIDSDYEVAKTAFLACQVANQMNDSIQEATLYDIAEKYIKNIDSCLIKNEILSWKKRKK